MCIVIIVSTFFKFDSNIVFWAQNYTWLPVILISWLGIFMAVCFTTLIIIRVTIDSIVSFLKKFITSSESRATFPPNLRHGMNYIYQKEMNILSQIIRWYKVDLNAKIDTTKYLHLEWYKNLLRHSERYRLLILKELAPKRTVSILLLGWGESYLSSQTNTLSPVSLSAALVSSVFYSKQISDLFLM